MTAGFAAAACVLVSCSGKPVSLSGSSSQGAPQVQQQFEQVVKSVLPSVVQIKAGSSTGSGVVYDNKGDVVTNDHVVSGATQFEVAPATGGHTLRAHLVGAFAPDDLAVIRVSGGSLKPASFASSSGLQIGQLVLAMGNPLGLSGSVSEGIISATGRTVSEGGSGGSGQGAASVAVIDNAVQTSAAINPGNSGGGLVNLSGKVIGIPTLAAVNPSVGSQAPGIGFAIPSDTVKNIAGQLIATGKVTNSGKASLGITGQTVADQSGNSSGVGVVSVTASGPAAGAGIKAGDIITEVGGKQTPDNSTLATVVSQHKPGDKVPVKIVRNGQPATVQVTLGTLGSSAEGLATIRRGVIGISANVCSDERVKLREWAAREGADYQAAWRRWRDGKLPVPGPAERDGNDPGRRAGAGARMRGRDGAVCAGVLA